MKQDEIRRIIEDRLGMVLGPDFRNDSPLFAPQSAGGLELDSLASLEIISAISDQYQIPMDDIEPADVTSVEALASYLERHLKGEGVPANAQSR